ncbi:MAG: hypothetical protein QOG03_1795 [Actinomycetota bacterium]|jgi:transglutaminase-like putative cysteine protease|nr:hypothetical protein [Actinomycetota bacterium]
MQEAAAATAAIASASAEPDAELTYRLRQQIRYEYDEPVRDVHQRLVVVPPAEHGPQWRTEWDLAVDGADVTRRRTSTDRFGNTVADVDLARVEESVTFTVTSTVVKAMTADPHVARWRRAHLASTRLTQPGDAIAALADEAKRAADPGAALCRLVHGALQYEWGVTDVSTTAAEALQVGRGVCQDYAHVMLAGCRSLGVAARYVSGHLLGEGGSHAWVEVLHPDPSARGRWLVEGWDPTHDARTGARHVTIAVGRDYADVAPMSGTYDGLGVGNRLSVVKTLTPSVP